jgi:hypothetical protein
VPPLSVLTRTRLERHRAEVQFDDYKPISNARRTPHILFFFDSDSLNPRWKDTLTTMPERNRMHRIQVGIYVKALVLPSNITGFNLGKFVVIFPLRPIYHRLIWNRIPSAKDLEGDATVPFVDAL